MNTARLELRAQILECTGCDLNEGCTSPVPFHGPTPAPVAVLGEAPGEQEDLAGQPFIGPAGELARRHLKMVELDPDQLAWLNTVSCLRWDTVVFLGDGRTAKLKTLVDSGYDGDVLAFDGAGHLVRRRVTGWHATPLGDRRLYRVTHSWARRNRHGEVGFYATGDHPVLTRRGWIDVGDLEKGDDICTGMGALSSRQRQLVLAGLLGDATFDRRVKSSLTFESKFDEAGYILAKWRLLEPLGVLATSRGRGWPRVAWARAKDILLLHPEVRALAEMGPFEWVRHLDDFGLACWWMDDGHLRQRTGRRPDGQIATCRWPEAIVEGMAEELRRKGFGARAKSTSMGWRIMFGVEQTPHLSERVARHVVPSMTRKVLPEHRGQCGDWPAEPEAQLGYAPVTAVEVPVTSADQIVYCLDVEEDHNFLTAGGVVHNCYPHGTPTAAQIAACAQNREDQLALIRPGFMVIFGRTALQALRPDLDITRGRGRPFLYGDIVCWAVYHPAAILRNRLLMHSFHEDLEGFADMVAGGRDSWWSYVPDRCSTCPDHVARFDPTGIGWCERHFEKAERTVVLPTPVAIDQKTLF